MPKKIDEGEVKKECPSCGLGVSLESKICEFCGWDFDEEDEWILQIEKLERDLMLEKQKFEPGTVDDRIESTLHSPVTPPHAAAQPVSKSPEEPPKKEPAPIAKRGRASEAKKPVSEAEPVIQKPVSTKQAAPKNQTPIVEKAPPSSAAVSEPAVERTPEHSIRSSPPAKPATPGPVIARIPESAPQETPSSKVRRMRVVKSAPVQESDESATPKRRLVRKVKGRS